MGLGFAVGRRVSPAGARVATGRSGVSPGADSGVSESSPGGERELAQTLRSFRGEWVATKDGELLVAAATPKDLVGWLARHDRRADSMFRVPEDELALGGLAPL
jgi:hypothetical protein